MESSETESEDGPGGGRWHVVSGLPRSGTSLMMQVCEAAGIPVFTDGRRGADESNPQGYYEHAGVAGLLQDGDRGWLAGARGKVVKVVAPLLMALPEMVVGDGQRVRVVFMEREMEEILGSQAAMLGRLGKPAVSEANRAVLARVLERKVEEALAWMEVRGIRCLRVRYGDLVRTPELVLPGLAAFLGVEGREVEMGAVIRPSLYRARGG
jgi:hypothetical protein